MDVTPGTTPHTTVDGVDYPGHAQDQMQGRGVPPSAVKDAVHNGTKTPGKEPGTTEHTSGGPKVVTNKDGKVITVITQ